MNKGVFDKMRQCKALQGKTVLDVITLPEFKDNLGKYWEEQRAEWSAARASLAAQRKVAGTNRLRLPAHTLDRIIDWTLDELHAEFVKVVQRGSSRPAAIREYVGQIGMQAYNITIANFVVAEFPELKEYFFPKQIKN